MERFSANAWEYDVRNPLRTLSQLPAELIFRQRVALMRKLRAEGGKALGLRVCEQLVAGSSHLHVPPWLALTPDDILLEKVELESWAREHGVRRFKVRSSARSEDWLSGNSGEQQSRTVQDPARIYAHAREISRLRDPVIVQSFVEGIGVVVDIAHSPILGQTIVRVSTGREQRLPRGERLFTSATNDHEGRHEVIDPQTGQALTERVIGTLFEGSCLHLDLPALAQELWNRVLAHGINFGIQLELVIHPDTPEIWWLVQIRPSPNQIRYSNLSLSPLPGALVTTPAINRSFAVTQMAETTTRTIAKWVLTAAVAGVDEAKGSWGEFLPKGILVWARDPAQNFGQLMYEAAHRAGAILQVTRCVTAINTTHGQILLSPGYPTQASFIALPDRTHAMVVERLKAQPQRMSAISDGLVGQLAFI